MNNSILTDLDELILTVRTPTSKQYILDAINAYRSRAFRASIISTWIAVTYDIIAKIRELASQNDKNASQYATQIDKAIENHNIQQLSNIEDDLLQKAYREFAFLSKQEFDDLDRLRKDRNLCAHPAFVDINDLFQPTPEVVRTHIVHAILHLLRHPPVQGKSAVERFFTDIKSESFPSDFPSITEFVRHKYLKRAKDTMIRSLIIALLKVFMCNEPDFKRKKQSLTYSLKAIHEINSHFFEQVLEQELSKIYEGLDDDERANVFRLLGEMPIFWNWLDVPMQLQCKEQFLKRLQEDDESIKYDSYEFNIFSALTVDELNQASIQRFQNLNFQSQCAVIEKNPKAEYIDRGIVIFEKAGSYPDAEFIGQKVLLSLASLMTPEHIQRILLAIINNQRNQIIPAAGMPKILESFWDLTQQHSDKTLPAWEQVANKINAGKYTFADYSNLLKKIRAQAGQPVNGVS